MSAFEALLRLQDHDLRIDQLRHKLATLPERAAVTVNEAAQRTLTDERVPVQARRDELAREQKRIEDEVAAVEAKAGEVHAKLYSGTVTSPRELQALQADHDALKRRQAQLEDMVIDLMEQTEPVDAGLAERDQRAATLASEGIAAREALASASAAVEADLAAAEEERPGLADAVPPDQLTSYEKLRPQYGGIAVARLVGTQCGGCHLALSAVALQEIRRLPPDAVAHCEECGRLLVR
jgi:predicted  nucleic acid-binding Zn-ribbon protein